MFAPPIKAKAKTASHADSTRAPKPPQYMPWRPRLDSAEQMLTLQRAIGNQAVLRLLSQRAKSLTESTSPDHHEQEAQPVKDPIMRTPDQAAAPSLSWDFSRIPLHAPDHPVDQ